MQVKDFPAFYRANVKQVYRFLLYRVNGRREIAEDLTQDVFVKALVAFEAYDPTVSQTAWIFTIARHHLLNYLEKTRPGIDLEEVENILTDGGSWEQTVELREAERRLLEAIHKLPSEDAQIIRLKYLEGWSYEEMAKILQKSSGSLRVQAHRILKVLQKMLKQL